VFHAGRIEVLRIIASQAAISLQNARLLQQEAEKHRMLRDLDAAAEIQRALAPVAPQIAQYEIEAHTTPADQVGGDYYDVISVDGFDWFVIGDVCGHGLPAALVMIMCQTALHAVLHLQPDIGPAAALSQVNALLKANLERFRESKYVAATLFRHAGDGVIEYAGLHEDILVYRHAEGSVEAHAATGTWLGIVDEIEPLLTVHRLQLAPGDVLALYTDGLTDARNADGELWGRQRLAELLKENGKAPLATIKARILAAVAGHQQTDDVTLFLMRRQGA
jgi:serine phosphatase RsbU (regulator of sigma subunit)